MYDETDVQVELIVPPGVHAPIAPARNRNHRSKTSPPARPRRKVKIA
jgi:hypothetical protein